MSPIQNESSKNKLFIWNKTYSHCRQNFRGRFKFIRPSEVGIRTPKLGRFVWEYNIWLLTFVSDCTNNNKTFDTCVFVARDEGSYLVVPFDGCGSITVRQDVCHWLQQRYASFTIPGVRNHGHTRHNHIQTDNDSSSGQFIWNNRKRPSVVVL